VLFFHYPARTEIYTLSLHDALPIFQQVDETHGRIDIFCSNAGIAVGGGPEAENDDWQRIWEVNVMAHVFVARHVMPSMLARKEGYLVGTVSAAGLLNHMFAAPYGVTKAAALSFFEWLAIAHGDSGIRVSCLCPQGVKTDMLAQELSQLRIDFLGAGALEPEVVALLAGMAGVILLISALSLMRSPSAAVTSTPAVRAAQPPRRRSRNDIWLGTGGIALAIVLLAGLAMSAGFWWSVAGLVLLLPMILGSLYLCVRFLRASP